jgi:hypothetical protein
MRRSIEQRPADPATPKVRLDEHSVELSANQGRKSRNLTLDLGHDYLAICELCRREMDCVGIGQQLVAIVGEFERCATLKLFQLSMLFGTPEPQIGDISAI